jgi:replicative DNA helicase
MFPDKAAPLVFANKDLEESVIGCIISYDNAAELAFKIIAPDAFFYYKDLASILYDMHKIGNKVDFVSVYSKNTKKINASELATMVNKASHIHRIEEHSRILFQFHVSRNLAKSLQASLKDIIGGQDVFETLEQLKKSLEIDIPGITTNNASIRDVDAIMAINDAMINGYKSFKMPWKANGFNMEFEYKHLAIIAAGPSVGKTAFMLNVCFHLAQMNIPVQLFNFESGMDKLKLRMLSIFTGISSSKMKRGKITQEEFRLITESNLRLEELPIYCNEYDSDVNKLCDAIRSSHKLGVNIFFIDNMSNVRLPDAERHDLKIDEFLKPLTRLKKELNITIVLLVHISRETGVKKSKMQRLKNSGSFEQDADMILYLERIEDSEIIEVECIKNRDDERYKVNLRFHGDTQKFYNDDGIETAYVESQFNFTKRSDDFIDWD